MQTNNNNRKPSSGHRPFSKNKPYNKPYNNKNNKYGHQKHNPKKLTPEEIEERKQKRFEKLMELFEKQSKERTREYKSRLYFGQRKIKKQRAAVQRRSQQWH